MIVFYKNSFLASIVSIFGCILCTAAVFGTIEGAVPCLLLLIPGIPLLYLASKISKTKEFKKWWAKIEAENRVPAIMTSLDAAVIAYRENPDEMTLKKIEELNPQAAMSIRQAIELNKQSKKK